MIRALAAVAVVLVFPTGAYAQADDQSPPAGQPPATQGPMIVERLHSGFMFAPEVKATLFDKKVSPLVGGSAGWVADETFFVGGAGYWMPERGRSDRELAYGGAVLQWFVRSSDRFGFSAKALLGGGRATLPDTITQILPLPQPRELERLTPAQITDLLRTRTVTQTIRLRENFVMAEPEVNARIGLARHVRLTVGAGYRFAGTDWRRGGDARRRLSGATGSLGVQIGR